MFRNYFKLAIRNIKRHKGYSAINIFGFAVGITCCLLISLYIFDELGYDQFYPNSDRIYRVVHTGVVNNHVDHTARTSPPLAKVLAEEFPEVEAVVKCRNYGYPVFRYKDKVFSEERVFNVDPSFFDVFQMPFIHGNKETALNHRDAIVLTRSMAEKYFGDENPIGKIINADKRNDYIVTAVIEDVRENSHFHFDFLRSLERYDDARSPVWVFNDFYTYILVKENVDLTAIEEKLYDIVKERLDPFLRGILGISVEQFLEGGGKFRYYFQPLTDIHLHSHLDFELEPNGDIDYVYIFASIAICILLIACINFINLATARSAIRAREVGIRKTIGSTRFQIMRQFLAEAILMTFLAVILSWFIAYLVLPLYNQIAGKNMVLPLFEYWWVIPFFLVFALVIGVIAGFYPAFFLSSFKPVTVLKGDSVKNSWRSNQRTCLVILQFSISTILIIATLTVHRQLNYIQNKNLGFSKDQVVVIHKVDDLGSRLDAFKSELLTHNDVLNASNSMDLIGNHVEVAALVPEGSNDNNTNLVCYMIVDPDFLDTYGIKLKSGRFFEESRMADKNQMVLNETAVQNMGLEDPIGRRLVNSLFPDNHYPIIGTVQDFHFQSLRQKIQPMVFSPFQNGQRGRYLSVRIRPENVSRTLRYLEESWKEVAQGQAFEYEFFNDHFERIYMAEQRTELIYLIFSVLAISIACLGLFGLSAFITERRMKEVGVRKVLGSSVTRIVLLLTGQFLKWVLVANLLAWPIAWYIMTGWLDDFVYRISIGLWIFLIAGIIAVIMSTLTVVWQSLRVAILNPVDVLKYE